MKRNILVLGIVLTVLSSCSQEIVCDKFDLSYDFQDQVLLVSLDTDLPDFTEVGISVSRDYTEVATESTTNATYSLDYFSAQIKLSSLSQPLEIDVSDAVWFEKSEAHQKEMEALDKEYGTGDDPATRFAYEVETIAEVITIRAVVHTNQPSMKFGEKNKNLIGQKVESSTLGNVVSSEQLVELPMQ
jgi:hypothetical protein